MSTTPIQFVFSRVLAATLSSAGIVASGTVLSQAQSAAAQENPLAGTIRSIVVEGNQRVEARTVQSYLLVEPGDPFDQERIDLSLKTLFATQLFADVAIDRRGNDLVIKVVERPIINRVIFEGNRNLDDDKIREEIQAAPRGVFTAARVQADVQRILELYRQSGRFSATVRPQYKPLAQNRVDLIFEIVEGPTTGVESINFIGNEAYSDGRLRSEIVTRTSKWWRFFSSNDNYDPDRLDFDRELLRQFYQNNGYYNFTVVSAVADLTPDQEDFFITFTVDEGEQYTFGDISVTTELEKLNGEGLRRAVGIQSGDLFRSDDIEDAIDSLTYASGIAGFAFVDVQPRITADEENNQINVEFVVNEGPRVYLEKINIIGNTQTLDRVIRRELRIAEGDAFNRVLLDRSRNRVRALGFFEEVEIEERPGSEPDRTVVDIRVKEQPTGELAFAAGFSSVNSFLIDARVSQRNLRGTGQSLSAQVSASQRQQVLDIRFTEPRFLGRNLIAGFDVFSTRSDFLDVSNFETETIGAGFRLGFPVTDRTSMQLRYTLRQDDVSVGNVDVVIDENGDPIFETVVNDNNTPDDPSDDFTTTRLVLASDEPLPNNAVVTDVCSDQLSLASQNQYLTLTNLCREERSDLSSILGYSFQYDGRNDPFEPTRGYDFLIQQDLAGLGGDVQYLRTEVTGATYRGIAPGWRASWRLSAGYIFPFGDEDSLRINNRFFRGGNSFRGFDVAGLGPRQVVFIADENGEFTGEVIRERALGGQLYYQSTMELTVPNLLPEEYGVDTALFVDAGSLGFLPEEDQEVSLDGSLLLESETFARGNGEIVPGVRTVKDGASLRASAGLSVFWDSPFGRVRFDFSQILRKEDYDRSETFRFSTSTTF